MLAKRLEPKYWSQIELQLKEKSLVDDCFRLLDLWTRRCFSTSLCRWSTYLARYISLSVSFLIFKTKQLPRIFCRLGCRLSQLFHIIRTPDHPTPLLWPYRIVVSFLEGHEAPEPQVKHSRRWICVEFSNVSLSPKSLWSWYSLLSGNIWERSKCFLHYLRGTLPFLIPYRTRTDHTTAFHALETRKPIFNDAQCVR